MGQSFLQMRATYKRTANGIQIFKSLIFNKTVFIFYSFWVEANGCSTKTFNQVAVTEMNSWLAWWWLAAAERFFLRGSLPLVRPSR